MTLPLAWRLGFGQLLAWASSYYLLAVLAKSMKASFNQPLWAIYGCLSLALVVSALLARRVGRFIDQIQGRGVLMASNALFASALLLMALAGWTRQFPVFVLAWAVMGIAMSSGLYDSAFSTLVRHQGVSARRGMVLITLVAGFASSCSWPISHYLEQHWGWPLTCLFWALLHLLLGWPLHRQLPPEPAAFKAIDPSNHPLSTVAGTAGTTPAKLWALAAAFTLSGFIFASLAAYLPALLESQGCSPTAAVWAASWVGVSQVAARLLDAAWLQRFHPLISGRLATVLHPLAALLLYQWQGLASAVLFTVLHGAGVGLMTIVKGTLPLALFGAQGFGERAGWLEAPSKLAQASAPLLYGWALGAWHGHVLWLTFGLGVIASAILFALQRDQ